jgi:hypothetical protein
MSKAGNKLIDTVVAEIVGATVESFENQGIKLNKEMIEHIRQNACHITADIIIVTSTR